MDDNTQRPALGDTPSEVKRRDVEDLPPHLQGVVTEIYARLDRIDEIQRQLKAAPSPLLTRHELADYLRCSVRFVDSLIADGAIPSVEIGTLRRFPQDGVDAFLRECASGDWGRRLRRTFGRRSLA